ncbi:ankyrin repeat-containing protein [Fusarium sporotrichioides]|uniref:Ankyrin repeat-containing protein n=1 Tax=Fusarium sporotrichioides TaxID=5514 RepID=A0A395RFQ4_FUSSP|nr:ankyrin repeat-containing protein [Fusarium sporotrichioides]
MLLDELDAPLDDVVVVDRLHIADYNESNILPQDKTTLDRLLKWLNPTKYAGDGSELKKHTTSHLEGTSQWLIDSPVFEQWHRGNSNGVLWIRGVPGAGKSVLAAKLIAHLASEECPVMYFFFRHTIQSNHRPEAALRDWIGQILPFSPPLQLALKNLTSGDIDIGSVDDLSMSELWHLFRLALKSIPKAYCVVDALDEMDQHVMEHFLQVLDQLGHVHPDRVKLIITSRPLATIEKIVRDLRLLDIRLGKDQVNPDILKYLHHRLDRMSLASKIRDAIMHELVRKADGQFLYAKFAMDTISGLKAMTMETVTEALDNIPVELSAIYRNLLRDQMARTDLPEGFCILVLQLVTHATRPLRLLEIADCIKVTKPQFGQDTGLLKSRVRMSCGPLLEVLPDESVRVVHHSLTEYLFGTTRSGSDKDVPLFEPGPMHNLLALTCLSYLRAGCLDNLKADDPRDDYRRLWGKEYRLPPFLMYAADNWHLHTKKSFFHGFPQDETNSSILTLLMTPKYSKRLSMLDNRRDRSGGEDLEGVPRGIDISLEAEALLFAIHLDLASFVKYFLSRDHGDAATYSGAVRIEPPLHRAIRKGNLEIVRLLIINGAKTSHHNSRGDTPLHLALGGTYSNRRMYPAIVEYLLEAGADPWQDRGRNKEFTDNSFILRPYVPCPPIKAALTSGGETIAKLFLPYIKSKEMAQRALHWVISMSPNADVITLILNLGLVDINGRIHDKTPLFQACAKLDPKAVSILLEAGADPNVLHDVGRIYRRFSPGPEGGQNVLHVLAAQNDYHCETNEEVLDKRTEECFELVLAAGADVHQVNKCKLTPLHLARTPRITKVLLNAGADPLARNMDGSTPLHVAYSIEVIEVLLTKTDINVRDFKGKTVLLHNFTVNTHRDRTDGKPATGKALRLLDLGADPNITDNNGDGIFHYLASRGGMDNSNGRFLLERLIQSGVDANLRNNEGQTAIYKLRLESSSIQSGMTDLEVLLELTDIDINVVDNDGNTLLFRVIDGGGVAGDPKELDRLITTMVKAGARFGVTDKQGRTLLHAAMRYGHGGEEVLKVLVEQGVDPKQTDDQGNTIWHAVVPRFISSMMPTNLIQNITAMGVDIRKPNNCGRLPLHLFCDYYQSYLKDRLRPRFQDRTLRFGKALFDYMLDQGHDYINKADDDGVSPLHLASTFSTYLTKLILDVGADATQTTHEGLNIFHLAARCRESNIIGLLMDWYKGRISMEKLGEAVNAKDKRGRNPLYYACASGHYQSVELLIAAGAMIDLETYEGSALQGCVEFEGEHKGWPDIGTSAFDAAHFSDTKRPEEDTTSPRKFRRPVSFEDSVARHQNRIDEILDYLINSTTPSSWREIDRAIVVAANRQHDYTVESLLRVRKSLGMGGPLSGAAEVQACLERRASVVASVTEGNQAGNGFADQILFIIEHRIYHAFPSQINGYLSKPDMKEFYEVSLELVRYGFAGLLDVLLTPDLISDLEKCSHSAEDGSGRKPGGDMVSLLLAACQSEQPNLPVIKVLVKKGAKLDKCSVTNQTTSLHAIVKTLDNRWWQTAQALPYMLGQTVDLEVRDKQGLTPLNVTLEEKDHPSWNCQATEMLLRAGADPTSVDNLGKSCLARVAGHESLFKLLIRHVSDVGPVAMTAAILAKDAKVLEMMLASGGDPNARKVGEETPSFKSTYHGPVRSGATDPSDETELYALDLLITSMGHEEHDTVCDNMMKLLLDHGANPNSRYSKTTVAHRILERERSCSIYSTSGTRNRYADVIVQHPLLDVDLKDAAGITLLQAACKVGDLKSAQVLIQRGSNVYQKDKDGRSILHLLLESFSRNRVPEGRQDFLEYLVTLEPELLQRADKQGKTPLHHVILRGAYQEEIEFFVLRGADVCAKDADGNTPLHHIFKRCWKFAVHEGNLVLDEAEKRMVRLVLSRGADINARNQSGETPVFYYFREGSVEDRRPIDEAKDEKPKVIRGSRNLFSDLVLKTSLEQETILWAFLDQLGIDWTVVNNERQSLLHVVAANKRKRNALALQRFQFLLGKGLDAMAENDMHQTALDVAAANGAKRILALFNVP